MGENDYTHLLGAISQWQREQRSDIKCFNALLYGLQFRRIGGIGHSQWTTLDDQVLKEWNKLGDDGWFSGTHAFSTMFFDTAGRETGFAHGCDAARQFPLTADFFDCHCQYCVCRPLAIELLGDLSYP